MNLPTSPLPKVDSHLAIGKADRFPHTVFSPVAEPTDSFSFDSTGARVLRHPRRAGAPNEET